MLMKIEKNITEREKDKEITPAVDWKNSSRSRSCSENFQTHRHNRISVILLTPSHDQQGVYQVLSDRILIICITSHTQKAVEQIE